MKLTVNRTEKKERKKKIKDTEKKKRGKQTPIVCIRLRTYVRSV